MGTFLFFFFSGLLVLSNCHQLNIPTGCNDPIMFVFGDSMSDTGGKNAAHGYNAAFTGDLTPYPYGNLFPSPPSERFSNGRLIIDFLCENVSTTYLQAYLNSLEANFGNGVNFAVSGAATTWNEYKLEIQINQFVRFHNLSLDLLSKGSKQKLVTEEGFKRALYIIDIGLNDLAAANFKSSYAGMMGIIPNITLEIKKAVQRIYDKGGRRFWVHNTGPLGCPSQSAKYNATDLDQYGCLKYLNEGSQMFNKNLSALCEELRNEKKDATIVYVDVYSIKYDLFANAKSYGFDHPMTPCYNSDGLCKDQSKYISWDGIHYTEAANAIVAKKITSANYSTPQLPFNFFCDGSVN